MNASIIVELPEDISLCILSTWLELKSVNLLDTSLCNSQVRNYVENLLRSPLLTVKGHCNESSVEYIRLRGLKLSELKGEMVFFKKIFQNPIDTSRVTSIFETDSHNNEPTCRSDDWIGLINSCLKLSKF